MEGKHAQNKSQQQTLDWCDRETITLVQQTIDGKADPKIIKATLINESFFRTGFLRPNKINDIIDAREKMIKNKSFIPTFIPTEKVVFKLEKYIREDNERADDLVNQLWYPFRKHNLNKEHMECLIRKARKALKKKGRIILPAELITLAALNQIDNYLSRPRTSSNCFKTRVLNDLVVGRRASATRELKRKGYITQIGNRWKRTDKQFDETDFIINLAE